VRERKREGRGGLGLFIGDRCLAGGGRVRVWGGDRRWGDQARPGPLLEEEGESITRAQTSARERRGGAYRFGKYPGWAVG
jgi:hypothetical protein